MKTIIEIDGIDYKVQPEVYKHYCELRILAEAFLQIMKESFNNNYKKPIE